MFRKTAATTSLLFLLLALGFTGCKGSDSAPAATEEAVSTEAPAEPEAGVINTEDFESGDLNGMDTDEGENEDSDEGHDSDGEGHEAGSEEGSEEEGHDGESDEDSDH